MEFRPSPGGIGQSGTAGGAGADAAHKLDRVPKEVEVRPAERPENKRLIPHLQRSGDPVGRDQQQPNRTSGPENGGPVLPPLGARGGRRPERGQRAAIGTHVTLPLVPQESGEHLIPAPRKLKPKAPQAQGSPDKDVGLRIGVDTSYAAQPEGNSRGPPWVWGPFERPHRGVPVALEFLLGEVGAFTPIQSPGMGVGADSLPPPPAVGYALNGTEHLSSPQETSPEGARNSPEGIVGMGPEVAFVGDDLDVRDSPSESLPDNLGHAATGTLV